MGKLRDRMKARQAAGKVPQEPAPRIAQGLLQKPDVLPSYVPSKNAAPIATVGVNRADAVSSRGSHTYASKIVSPDRLERFLKYSRLKDFLHPKLEQQKMPDYLWIAFRAIGAFREGLLLDKNDGNGKLVIDRESPMSVGFADAVTDSLVRGILSIDCSACLLRPSVTSELPGGESGMMYTIREIGGIARIHMVFGIVMPENSIALGLIREDGFASPLVLSTGLMLRSDGSGMRCAPYDHETDFAREFRWIGPDSFI